MNLATMQMEATMTAKRIICLTAMAIALGISSTSNAELHIDGGPEGYVDCWITWIESGPGGKAGLECYEITDSGDRAVKKDGLNRFTNCEIRTSGGRSRSRTYLVCETV